MGLFNSNKQKRVHTTMDHDDFNYCKKHNLKFAHLIRAGVRDHRVHTEDPNANESARELKNQRDRALKHRNSILQALQKILSEDQYLKFIQSLTA